MGKSGMSAGCSKMWCRKITLVNLSVVLLGLSWFAPTAAASNFIEIEGELHSQCWSMGGGIGNVQGLDDDLAKIAGLDSQVTFIEYTQNFYLDPYVSEEFNGSLNLMNNFSVVQVAVGRRWSTVPFPKVFLRPWVGLYATLNFLEDDRDLSEYSGEEDENDGIGVGLATTLGVTMRLSRSLALEVAVKGDYMALFGRLEAGETFADAFMMRGVYLRLLFISK
jgi:hypothetical protein